MGEFSVLYWKKPERELSGFFLNSDGEMEKLVCRGRNLLFLDRRMSGGLTSVC